ncbi:hypothetical protein CYMTET_17697 [Cymbomonas tetramitiformis]|uniref:Uncharacterized protein n=1 Tax=Cymbomonas tetramitiformis TaxID=36881 RepID=A0AAE0G9K6_9CHLO|nr:hypothetical protein CYMTET_17697 [Cymbomonas tetramitiformis]
MADLLLRRIPETLDNSDGYITFTSGLRGGFVEREHVAPQSFIQTSRWDPCDTQHCCLAEASGILRSVRIARGGASVVTRFQLHTDWAAVERPWKTFELIPQVPGSILFCQRNSNKILFTTLPFESEVSVDHSRVFCVGTHSGRVECLAVRLDGALVASGSDDGAVRLWRLTDGVMMLHVDNAHDGGTLCVAFAGSMTLATGGKDGFVRVWIATTTGSLVRAHQMPVIGCAPVSSIAVWSSDVLRLLQFQGVLGDWPTDAPTESVVDALAARPPPVDVGDILAAGTVDGVMHVWESKYHESSGGALRGVSTWRQAAVAHHAQGFKLGTLSFRSDGKALASGSDHRDGGGVVRMYETRSYRCAGALSLSAPIVACHFLSRVPDQHKGNMMVCSQLGPPRLLEAHMLDTVEHALQTDTASGLAFVAANGVFDGDVALDGVMLSAPCSDRLMPSPSKARGTPSKMPLHLAGDELEDEPRVLDIPVPARAAVRASEEGREEPRMLPTVEELRRKEQMGRATVSSSDLRAACEVQHPQRSEWWHPSAAPLQQPTSCAAAHPLPLRDAQGASLHQAHQLSPRLEVSGALGAQPDGGPAGLQAVPTTAALPTAAPQGSLKSSPTSSALPNPSRIPAPPKPHCDAVPSSVAAPTVSMAQPCPSDLPAAAPHPPEVCSVQQSHAAAGTGDVSEAARRPTGEARSSVGAKEVSANEGEAATHFSQPRMLSTALLGRKLDRAKNAQFDVPKAEAAAKASANVAAAAVDRSGPQYSNLPDVDKEVTPTAPRRIGKQLDPKWVSALEMKPDFDALWDMEDSQPQVCCTEGLGETSMLLSPSAFDLYW